jgi:hypothetical protein
MPLTVLLRRKLMIAKWLQRGLKTMMNSTTTGWPTFPEDPRTVVRTRAAAAFVFY